MFKILIVEDHSEKLRNILLALKKIDRIDIDKIDHELDANSAKIRLKNTAYDLLILDIAIPLRREEQIHLEGGIQLLDEVLTRDVYKIPSHIIGLTAKAEILSQASKNFNSTILSVIQYSETDLEWQDRLVAGMRQRLKAKEASIKAPLGYDYDVAIITAVDCEFQAIKSLSKNWNRVEFPGDSAVYYDTVFEENDKCVRVIASCATQMGMTASSVLSLKLIHNFRPKYLFMTGIAASIKKSDTHGFGDVIAIDECWDGGAGKITEDVNGNNVFLPIAKHLRMNTDLSQKLMAIRSNIDLLREIKDRWKPNSVPNTELSLHVGSVASVAGVIENSAVVGELSAKDRKLLGLEMEAYGVYYSSYNCCNPKPIAAVLKSVSDFASLEKNDLYQAYASYTSAKVLYYLIMNELEEL